MLLKFKQRFTILDSYNIYDEYNNLYFKVDGKLALSHKFNVYDRNGELLAILRQRIITFLPKFDIYDASENFIGTISKKISFLFPKLEIDMNGWKIEGDFMHWEYLITKNGQTIATISKKLFRIMDTYTIEVDQENALCALLVVIAIDAIICSSKAIRIND